MPLHIYGPTPKEDVIDPGAIRVFPPKPLDENDGRERTVTAERLYKQDIYGKWYLAFAAGRRVPVDEVAACTPLSLLKRIRAGEIPKRSRK